MIFIWYSTGMCYCNCIAISSSSIARHVCARSIRCQSVHIHLEIKPPASFLEQLDSSVSGCCNWWQDSAIYSWITVGYGVGCIYTWIYITTLTWCITCAYKYSRRWHDYTVRVETLMAWSDQLYGALILCHTKFNHPPLVEGVWFFFPKFSAHTSNWPVALCLKARLNSCGSEAQVSIRTRTTKESTERALKHSWSNGMMRYCKFFFCLRGRVKNVWFIY